MSEREVCICVCALVFLSIFFSSPMLCRGAIFRWRNSQWMGFWDSGAWRWSIPLA
ncbi:hypothetical protein QJS10_CPB14g01235 [Acorus calamus]|uniref:Uncharacterized protein n=1 Tax=Acorus calamus TaxID=4465 RepID=A0AAV9DD48_ACOCL|nr:hypothetical protein QJS10_CPB14g01235 [Acorus calamus]